MRLAAAIADLEVLSVSGDASVDVTSVDHDSRAVHGGGLFCCIPGDRVDGHDFAREAVDSGAVALLVEHDVDLEVPQVRVSDVRGAMGPVAAAVYGRPSERLEVIGVTGTNGKTTTTYLLRNVLEEAGRRTEVLGTLSGERTTPEAPELQRRLAAWLGAGVQAVAMEVSSHALALRRVDGTRYRVAVFTNLSRDHLDFHHSMEEYFEAKARLFDPELSRCAVVDIDGPYGRLLRDAARIPTVGFSSADLRDVQVGLTSSRFTWRDTHVELGLGGAFNVSNALAAAEAAVALGIEPAVVAAGLGRPVVVPGRFETIDVGQPFTVIVDYAHTPDGLERLLETARDLAGGGTITVVFGCGGDRDSTKRPVMGEVAARLADRVVLTADNSRGEDTAAIIDSVEEGIERARRRADAPELVIEPDRREAIASALDAARTGDVVLIAGKGHETTQTIGSSSVPFDDRVVARAELTRLAGRTAGRGEGTAP